MIKFLAKRRHKGGLKPLKRDYRDFSLGIFGWEDYKPLSPKVHIATLSIKNQTKNNCTFQAGAVQKELDENTILSARFATIMGIKEGLVSGDGLSDLRTVQKITQKYGICEESLLPERSDLEWSDYSDSTKITPQILANAGQHKSASYWMVTNTNQLLKLLDQGRTVTIGLDWREAWNMRSGFSFPWLLNLLTSFIVGGHAVLIIGYEKNYNGIPLVFEVQNSYGAGYGKNGCFFIKPEDLQPYLNKYGAYTQSDIAVDVAKFIIEYSNKVVKESNNANCYKIINGKKCLIPDIPTLWSFGYLSENIQIVDKNTLDAVPLGVSLNFFEGQNVMPMKAFAQYLSNANVMEKETVKEQFKRYFQDLFNN